MIEWSNVSFEYDSLGILKDFSLSLEDAAVTVLLGPSGCGKTTLLHLAAGLRRPSEGHVDLKGKQQLSYLFQKPRLLPWKTVEENIAFALESSLPKQEIRRKTDETLKLVGLEDFAGYLPRQLSGGMEQRASIARAFAPDSDLILMDEPFKGLDLKMKMPLLELILEILKKRQTRTILVTHDVREAILMGDRIILLQGPPLEVRENLINPCRPDERTLDNSGFYELEHRLYGLILGQAGPNRPSGNKKARDIPGSDLLHYCSRT